MNLSKIYLAFRQYTSVSDGRDAIARIIIF